MGAVLVCMVAGWLNGCAARDRDILHFLREHENHVSAIEYRVGIPDSIGVIAPDIEELDGQARRIQPDGKIALRLLGEVKVVGMTAREIAAKLQVLASRYYVDPKISVRVLAYSSKKYYVHGESRRAGARPYTGRDTVLDAVLASGVNSRSWTSRVTVTRPAHGEIPVRTVRVNVDNMLRNGDWQRNILLEPNDVVFVPPTPLAWIANKVRDLLLPVYPVIEAYTTPLYFENAAKAYDGNFTGIGTFPTGPRF